MELLYPDVVYKFDFEDVELEDDKFNILEYKGEVYDKIKTALEIEKEGYNVYLIDDFSKIKLKDIMKYISEILKEKDKPKDICYVIKDNMEDPFPLYVSEGKGYILEETIKELQNTYYKVIHDFYNGSSNKEKVSIIDSIEKKKSKLIKDLIDSATEKGFQIRATTKGFSFMPISNGKAMSEKEYDNLEIEKREDILKKVSELKSEATKTLEYIKNIEISEVSKIRKIMMEYLNNQLKDYKAQYRIKFSDDIEVVNFLDNMCENIQKDTTDAYTMVYEDDEDTISNIILRYKINVLVDNSKNKNPQIIFEEDPNVSSLLGSIEYKSQNGTYVTDISLIKSGSVLRANEGCLIVRANSLLSNSGAYYNLKRLLINGKVDLNYNKKYMDILSLSGLSPKPIKIKEKVIIIGDYKTYDILYNYDDDFKKIFKIKAQYNPVIKIDDDIKKSLVNNIMTICKNNNIKPLDKEAIREIVKFLSRKAENRYKLFIDDEQLSKILILANNKVKSIGMDKITEKDIRDILYKEDLIEKEIRDYYKENKILLDVKGKKIGQVNALSVIDTGYVSFGKPIKITCSCYKGDGDIIDVQSQSDLSGNIHSKSVNILKGFINDMFGKYNKLPVNFHLSFEQIYGKIDGDSASVAELIAMISSLGNVPINQNIAVTGSINQFGEVQPIGGVNEKIEGFYKVCKYTDSVKEKGVIIPYCNKNNLVLNEEVEEAIKEGEFHIYTMKTIKDAVKILIGNYSHILSLIKKEIRKYNKL